MWEQDENFINLENYDDAEFGRITLEPIVSNRGNWRCTNLFTPGKHNKILSLIPLYFFDEDIAKPEISLWIKLAKKFIEIQQNEDILFFMKPKSLYHGKHCIVSIGEFTTTDNIFSGEYVSVIVPPDLEPWLTVDAHDAFPRFYLSPIHAQLEAEEWLRVSQQFLPDRDWEELM